MSSLKFTDQIHWNSLEAHLAGGARERFAFAFTRSLHTTSQGPQMEVIGVELIEDADVNGDARGWSVDDRVLDGVHNMAIRGGYGLVEFHNHHLGPPVFSRIDEANLGPMADYVTSLMPDRPYGAGVYAEGQVRVEHWIRNGDKIHRGEFRSVTVCGQQFRLVNAAAQLRRRRFDRQVDLLGERGSATLAALRVAIVGAGGTGSHASLALGHLGVGEILVLDDDDVETTNLNRLVTAGAADIGAPKNLVARRRLREIDAGRRCIALPALTPDGNHPELSDVDLIVGCVDEDGPRDRLNQIAVDTATPYLDIATGIHVEGESVVIGGRAIFVLPGGPCLHCLDELDAVEIGRWTKNPTQRTLYRQRGYGVSTPNPAVVHLNGITVYAAISELIAWISGHRLPAQYLDVDLSGYLQQSDAIPGCRTTPRRPQSQRPGCIACGRPG